MPQDLTAEDWHTIHCATKAVHEPFTKPEGISAIAEANYRAGLAAGRARAIADILPLLELTRSEVQLMTGEMTAGEWRTLAAVLRNRATVIRALVK